MRVRTFFAGVAGVAVLAGCSTGPATDIRDSSAVLHATVSSADKPVSYFFQAAVNEQALGTGFGVTTPRRTLPARTAEKDVSDLVQPLDADSEYVYRLCGRQEGMTSDVCLGIEHFKTAPRGRAAFEQRSAGRATFTVPAGVTRVQAEVAGAEGGLGTRLFTCPFPGYCGQVAQPGGKGGFVRTILAVTPGQTLTLDAGTRGQDTAPLDKGGSPPVSTGVPGRGGAGPGAGGDGGTGAGEPLDNAIFWGKGSGGGGGGAASAVLLGDRLLAMAGGGGGAGANPNLGGSNNSGGDGGPAGINGVANTGSDDDLLRSGRGGGPDGIGAGGLPGGKPGAGRRGGDGGTDTTSDPLTDGGPDSDRTKVSGQGGGGGGGGCLPGGGGGSGRLSFTIGQDDSTDQGTSAGGGGGGSSCAPGGFGASYETGVKSGDGRIRITWVPPAGV